MILARGAERPGRVEGDVGMDRSAPSPRELLAVALGVARDAAATAYRMRVEGVSVAATKSTVTDVVTAADRAVERQVLDALKQLRPDDAVLGEEYGIRDTGPVAPGGVRWIVDPIDGTVNYLYGLPYSAVSLAAEVDGVVVAACGAQREHRRGVDGHGRGRGLARRCPVALLRRD